MKTIGFCIDKTAETKKRYANKITADDVETIHISINGDRKYTIGVDNYDVLRRLLEEVSGTHIGTTALED